MCKDNCFKSLNTKTTNTQNSSSTITDQNDTVPARNCLPLIDFIVNYNTLDKHPEQGPLPNYNHAGVPSTLLRTHQAGKNGRSPVKIVKSPARSLLESGRGVCIPSYRMYNVIPRVFTELKHHITNPSDISTDVSPIDNIMTIRPPPRTRIGKHFESYENPIQNLVLLASISKMHSTSSRSQGGEDLTDSGDPADYQLTYYLVPSRFLAGGCDGPSSNQNEFQFRRSHGNLQWLSYSRFDECATTPSKQFFDNVDIAENCRKAFRNGTTSNPISFMRWFSRSSAIVSKMGEDNPDFLKVVREEPIVLNPYIAKDGEGVASPADSFSWVSDSLLEFATAATTAATTAADIDDSDEEVELKGVTVPELVDTMRLGCNRNIKSFYTPVDLTNKFITGHASSKFKRGCASGHFDKLDVNEMPTLVINRDVRDNLIESIQNIAFTEKSAMVSGDLSSDVRLLDRCLFALPIDSWKLENDDAFLKSVWQSGLTGDDVNSDSPNKTTKRRTRTKKSDDCVPEKKNTTKSVNVAAKTPKYSDDEPSTVSNKKRKYVMVEDQDYDKHFSKIQKQMNQLDVSISKQASEISTIKELLESLVKEKKNKNKTPKEAKQPARSDFETTDPNPNYLALKTVLSKCHRSVTDLVEGMNEHSEKLENIRQLTQTARTDQKLVESVKSFIDSAIENAVSKMGTNSGVVSEKSIDQQNGISKELLSDIRQIREAISTLPPNSDISKELSKLQSTIDSLKSTFDTQSVESMELDKSLSSSVKEVLRIQIETDEFLSTSIKELLSIQADSAKIEKSNQGMLHDVTSKFEDISKTSSTILSDMKDSFDLVSRDASRRQNVLSELVTASERSVNETVSASVGKIHPKMDKILGFSQDVDTSLDNVFKCLEQISNGLSGEVDENECGRRQ